MKRYLLVCIAFPFGAAAQPVLLDQVKGHAVASELMATVVFRDECEVNAGQDEVAKLHCLTRLSAVERGAKFMSALTVLEATNGHIKTSDKLLRTKRFGEKIYEDCIKRHATEVDRTGDLSTVGPICTLEKTDAYAGMQGFMTLYRQSK